MRKAWMFLFLVAISAGLTGCNTVAGVGEDIQALGNTISGVDD